MTDKLRQAAEMVARELKEFTAYGYMYDGIMLDFGNEVEMLEKALAEPPNSTTDVVEPVAWVLLGLWKTGKYWPDDCFNSEGGEDMTPLYTELPKREWVGLIHDDILDLAKGFCIEGEIIGFAKAIEAKLKEKNYAP